MTGDRPLTVTEEETAHAERLFRSDRYWLLARDGGELVFVWNRAGHPPIALQVDLAETVAGGLLRTIALRGVVSSMESALLGTFIGSSEVAVALGGPPARVYTCEAETIRDHDGPRGRVVLKLDHCYSSVPSVIVPGSTPGEFVHVLVPPASAVSPPPGAVKQEPIQLWDWHGRKITTGGRVAESPDPAEIGLSLSEVKVRLVDRISDFMENTPGATSDQGWLRLVNIMAGKA